MKMAVKEFCDLPEPIRTFDLLFRSALESLVPELAACPWHVREREVVNLFVFRHLVPRFQSERLDISQIAIEEPVLKLRKDKLDNSEAAGKAPRETKGRYADIVVWPHVKATRWVTCRPLAHIEWKNISCLKGVPRPRKLEREHEDDICLLNHNRTLANVSYAVLTDQRNKRVELRCTRIQDGKEPEDFFQLEPDRVLQTGVIDVYQKPLKNQHTVCCLRYVPNEVHSGRILNYDELSGTEQGSLCPNPNRKCKSGTQFSP